MDIDMTRVTRRGPRIPTVLGVPRDTEDQSYVPTGAHVARVRERARDWVEDEARARASWRATRSKTNVVANALSRNVSHSAALITRQASLHRDFERAEIAVSVGAVTLQLAQLRVQPTLRQKIIIAQSNDPYLVEKHCLAEAGQAVEFSISSDGGLLFERRLCVPADSGIKTELLTKAHRSPFFMYPGSTKMYQDLKRVYWWCNMKREVAEFVSKCLVCQQVKAPRLIKSAHFIPGKSTYTASKWAQLYMSERLMGPELVQSTNQAIQKIRSRMQTAQSRQKSYADGRRKDLEFDVRDKVFLKVAPMKGVLRFERRGKLSPCFVGPFEILERIGLVAYRLALPPSLSTVHDTFHVFMLRKYVTDPSHVVDYGPLDIDENLSYTEQPVEVLAREIKKLRNREIPLVKVLWRNHKVEEATWEREDDLRARYPELFEE
ncbi:pol protein [Cucumis melo var. makuwa]|uniref:Pol protein n=1 Tax=Cucumis melo var. makuwa TaxID=1194695 RepID=A0A5A7VH56_CUCMM|nr:pol protein [Cucumis melo var. makuwa]